MGNLVLLSVVVTIAVSVTAVAHAATVCQGHQPKPGTVVRGPVLQIDNSSGLCVATGASPSTWVAIRLPSQLHTTRAALMAAAFGENATCVVGGGGVGDCKIDGQPLASALMRPQMATVSTPWR